jgi:hypothetical protein
MTETMEVAEDVAYTIILIMRGSPVYTQVSSELSGFSGLNEVTKLKKTRLHGVAG